MWNRLRRWLNEVPLENPIERRQAALFQLMLISLCIATLLTIPFTLATPMASNTRTILLGASILLGLAALSALILLRFSQLRLSVAADDSRACFWRTCCCLLHVGLFIGGVAMLGLVIPITLANFLIGRRGLLLCIGSSIAIVVTIGILQSRPTPLAGSNLLAERHHERGGRYFYFDRRIAWLCPRSFQHHIAQRTNCDSHP